jgi:hypothetical protein|tara:strand:+ start:776 stop:1609 length:834 start_codon:yes stop_codon:yes gene_type:complete
MAVRLKRSLTINAGTGVTLSDDGAVFDGFTPINQTISVGQDIDTSGNVQFNMVTASSYRFGDNLSIFDNGSFNNNLTNTGNTTITDNLTIPISGTVGGKVTAEQIVTELSSSGTIYNSGSTAFGDSIDDTHHKTGSLYQSGSFILNGYTISEISSDTVLSDSSATTLVTEEALKTYADSNIGTSVVEPYLRKNFNKTASTISNNTASFSAVSASAPDGITATSENDFLFFNNGQIMEHNALTIEQSGSTFMLISDPSSIGYNLESDDEIKAWGRFNA